MMRRILTMAALAAGLATAASATTTTTHHRHAAPSDDGSAAVRALNEKSLQQAEAGVPMTPPMSSPTMSDSGAAGTMTSGMNAAPSAPEPAAPTTPQ
jgi:hypothetical protein